MKNTMFSPNHRVKASTLMETLVATVLIVIVFMLASMIMNNLFSNSIKNNTRLIDAHIAELHYLYSNNKLEVPYLGDYKDWSIEIYNTKSNDHSIVILEASNSKTKQNLSKPFFETH